MSTSIVRGDVADQSWGLSLPGNFHQDITPVLYDANFLLPRDNFLIPDVVSKNTAGACYDRGYIDLRPGRKETIRQYITHPSLYVEDLHPYNSIGGGTGGVDNLNLLDNSAYPTPYAHMEGAEEMVYLAKQESAREKLDPMLNSYALDVFGMQGEKIIARHARTKAMLEQREKMLAARRELTLKEGQALNPVAADIGAANAISAESAMNIDRAAQEEIKKRAADAIFAKQPVYEAQMQYNEIKTEYDKLYQDFQDAEAKGDKKGYIDAVTKMYALEPELERRHAEYLRLEASMNPETVSASATYAETADTAEAGSSLGRNASELASDYVDYEANDYMNATGGVGFSQMGNPNSAGSTTGQGGASDDQAQHNAFVQETNLQQDLTHTLYGDGTKRNYAKRKKNELSPEAEAEVQEKLARYKLNLFDTEATKRAIASAFNLAAKRAGTKDVVQQSARPTKLRPDLILNSDPATQRAIAAGRALNEGLPRIIQGERFTEENVGLFREQDKKGIVREALKELQAYGQLHTVNRSGTYAESVYNNTAGISTKGANDTGLNTSKNTSKAEAQDYTTDAQRNQFLGVRRSSNLVDHDTGANAYFNSNEINQARGDVFTGLSLDDPQTQNSRGQGNFVDLRTQQAPAFDTSHVDAPSYELNRQIIPAANPSFNKTYTQSKVQKLSEYENFGDPYSRVIRSEGFNPRSEAFVALQKSYPRGSIVFGPADRQTGSVVFPRDRPSAVSTGPTRANANAASKRLGQNQIIPKR